MVYYRKYRPQKISELDSQGLRERLYSVLSSPSISHAFLFTGPKGLGKTSTARIIAKAVNCLAKRDLASPDEKTKNKPSAISDTPYAAIEPCNECEQCISITNGSNLDVLEIDGASNRGIDEIRDLREKIRLTPVSARMKVYIIDEVHMLTMDAFNALLKTLEEPPSHAMFIFCTTEGAKVPRTIVSRCFHIPLSLATEEELSRSFKRIAKGEKLDIEEKVFLEIAKLSDGSFRDGTKILEELVLISEGKKITKELLEEKYQVVSITHYVEKILEALAKKDTKAGLELVSELVSKGIDSKYFIEQLLFELHALLLSKVGIEKELRIQSLEFRIEEIKELVELLTKAHQEIKYAVLPQMPLEIAIIEWGMGEGGNKAKNVESEPQPTPPATSHVSPPPPIWEKLIEGVKVKNHLLAGVLRGCKFKGFSNGEIVIEAPSQFHKDRILEEKALRILEEIGSEVVGNPVKVLVELKGKLPA